MSDEPIFDNSFQAESGEVNARVTAVALPQNIENRMDAIMFFMQVAVSSDVALPPPVVAHIRKHLPTALHKLGVSSDDLDQVLDFANTLKGQVAQQMKDDDTLGKVATLAEAEMIVNEAAKDIGVDNTDCHIPAHFIDHTEVIIDPDDDKVGIVCHDDACEEDTAILLTEAHAHYLAHEIVTAIAKKHGEEP